MKDMLDMLLSLSKAKVKVQVDPARLRPSDVPILLADCRKFVAADRSWKPRDPASRQTLSKDLLDYWREAGSMNASSSPARPASSAAI